MDKKFALIERVRALLRPLVEFEPAEHREISRIGLSSTDGQKDVDKRVRVGVLASGTGLTNQARAMFGARPSYQSWSTNPVSRKDELHTPSHLR